ncbi:MAG: ADP-ribosylation factor-like protein [Candidatus Thorarchaeota archaeon]|jgi:GTPase SAR1 family protein
MQNKKQIAIALIGDSKVGKTTIVKLLDKDAKSQGTTYQLKAENISFNIWELQTSSFEPQRLGVFSTSFLNKSPKFNRYVIVVSNSTEEDVYKIKYTVKFLRRTFPNTRLAIIANKQDLEERFSSRRIEKMTKLPTLGLSAIDQTQRGRLLNFISYLIDSDVGL